MADVVGRLILLLGFAAVTIGCVLASRRLFVPPTSDDHAASRSGQRKAVAQRDEFKGRGSVHHVLQ